MNSFTRVALAPLPILAVLLAGCERPPIQTEQTGYRGTGMEQIYNPRTLKKLAAANQAPAAPAVAPNPDGPKAGATYQNVKVLGDLSVADFTRLMVSITQWVAPQEGCNYCHNPENLADDSKYTKVVARRMIQMTQHVNADWKAHVGGTGVTCYTCHRGKPVPQGMWTFGDGNQYQRHYLDRDGARVISHEMAPSNANRSSVKQTEWTYALMISMSNSLGVNCTYCHNTRQFASWQEAPPARVKALHGINMVRDVNTNFVAPLVSILPQVRLGEMGDAPKVQCQTCHQGVYKPLYGAKMAKDYPAIWGRPDWAGTPFPGLYQTAADSTQKVADAAATAPVGGR